MSIRRFFVAVACVAFLAACEKPNIDYIKIDETVFENNSSCDIVINRDGFDNSVVVYEHPQITIKASETVMVANGMGISGLFGKKCIVNFGNKVAVDYNILPKSQYNLTYVDNYEFVSFEKATTRRKYTFTDADYQFALEHGTKIE